LTKGERCDREDEEKGIWYRQHIEAFAGKAGINAGLFTLASLYEDLPSFLDILAVSGPGGAGEIQARGVRIMTIHTNGRAAPGALAGWIKVFDPGGSRCLIRVDQGV
jgi:hypothetical protein